MDFSAIVSHSIMRPVELKKRDSSVTPKYFSSAVFETIITGFFVRLSYRQFPLSINPMISICLPNIVNDTFAHWFLKSFWASKYETMSKIAKTYKIIAKYIIKCRFFEILTIIKFSIDTEKTSNKNHIIPLIENNKTHQRNIILKSKKGLKESVIKIIISTLEINFSK